jgi:Zn-dependent peptidase ImmA (M78 family)/transcriptional regulator with XRE-family HTH domain
LAIQPRILRWARETAGLSLDEAAQAIGLKEARGKTGADRLAALEEGDGEPSRTQLLRMSRAYRRPLLVFYLNEPPRMGDRGEDFRTLPGQQKQFNADLDALLRDIKARQGLIRSMLEDAEAPPLAFVGSATTDTSVGRLAALIEETIGFSRNEFRNTRTPDDAFTYLRSRIEATGVFVLLLGNLGSHHTNIPVEIFRGFALADPIAPLIVINDQDARSAWSFTALHEVVHLWLGATGISGEDASNAIEQYCNDVAGDLLVPQSDLKSFTRLSVFDAAARTITDRAEAFRVSRSMLAYKLPRVGLINRSVWAALHDHFTKEWVLFKQRQAEKNKAIEGGPSYYVVRRHRVGNALLSLVRRSLDDGIITYTKAGRVLGVKPTNVEPLLSVLPFRGGQR